jgi:hypothetical protein
VEETVAAHSAHRVVLIKIECARNVAGMSGALRLWRNIQKKIYKKDSEESFLLA